MCRNLLFVSVSSPGIALMNNFLLNHHYLPCNKEETSPVCVIFIRFTMHGMTHFPDAPLEQHTIIYNTRSTDSVTFKLPIKFVRMSTSPHSFLEQSNSGTCTLPSELLNSSNDVDDQNHTFHIFKRNLSEHLY